MERSSTSSSVGLSAKPIFNDSQDYRNFVDRLGNILSDTATLCYSWAQMTNHFHLFLSTGHTPLSTVMRRILTGYDQHMTIQEFVTDAIIEI
jgi:putative transposase